MEGIADHVGQTVAGLTVRQPVGVHRRGVVGLVAEGISTDVYGVGAVPCHDDVVAVEADIRVLRRGGRRDAGCVS